MNHHEDKKHEIHAKNDEKTGIYKFLPLIGVIGLVLILTIVTIMVFRFILSGPLSMPICFHFMHFFMAYFFIIFGLLKIINLQSFVDAFRLYDLPSQIIPGYAYAYPFLEFGLGLLYLFNLYPIFTNVFTLLLMIIGAIGVLRSLVKGQQLLCACMGALFRIPLTYVSLAEDILMGIMAAYMLWLQMH